MEFKQAPSFLTVHYGKRPARLCALRVNQTTATATGSGAEADFSHNANSSNPLKRLHCTLPNIQKETNNVYLSIVIIIIVNYS